MISAFRGEVDENCALLGYYTASSGNFLPTFRDNESFLSSEFKKFPCRVSTGYVLYRRGNSCGIITLPMHGRIARKQKEANMKIKRLYSMAGDRQTLRSVTLGKAVKSGRQY